MQLFLCAGLVIVFTGFAAVVKYSRHERHRERLLHFRCSELMAEFKQKKKS